MLGISGPHKHCVDPHKPWAALLCRQGCGASVGVCPQRGRVGTPWLRREDGLAGDLPPPGAPSPSTDGLCAVTRGLPGGSCARAESVSQPRFLSVVLKESVESADWAVLPHPRTEAAAAPGRERGEASQAPRAPSAEWVDLCVGRPMPVWSGAAGSRGSPGPPSHLRILYRVLFSVSPPSYPQACGEGERGWPVDTELVRVDGVMTGHPSHPDLALALTPTSCHSASPQEVTTALSSSIPLLPVTSSAPVSPYQQTLLTSPHTEQLPFPSPCFSFVW